jgi:hypothetical protein
MARATAFVGGLVCGLALGTLVIVSHADDVQAAVVEAAAVAHKDPVALAGAVATTGVDPWTYLKLTPGELEPPPREPVLPPPAAASPPAPASGVWDRLVQCEASGNWHASTGNGFQGGLQFTPGTWRAYGGVGSPAQASREAQIAVAERVLRGQGWQAWPACSRALGLR